MSETIEAGDNLAGKRAQFEAEKLSRRQALKRFGFRAAGAALAAFTVDDLARAVMSRMEKEKMMRGMTDGIAEEFKNAGVAFANNSIGAKCPDMPVDQETCNDAGYVSAWCSCINHQNEANCKTCCTNAYTSNSQSTGACSDYLTAIVRNERMSSCRGACSNPDSNP